MGGVDLLLPPLGAWDWVGTGKRTALGAWIGVGHGAGVPGWRIAGRGM